MSKSITRKFRKALRSNGTKFPLRGAFSLRINGNIVNDPNLLNLKNATIEILEGVPAGTILATYKPTLPAIEVSETRPLFKRSVREADPLKANSKRRVDYKLVKNPKAEESYYAKIEGKWKEVPAAYANPNYKLAA
jgi:hypothetical protein